MAGVNHQMRNVRSKELIKEYLSFTRKYYSYIWRWLSNRKNGVFLIVLIAICMAILHFLAGFGVLPSFAISAVISVVASARVVGLKALSIHRKTRGL